MQKRGETRKRDFLRFSSFLVANFCLKIGYVFAFGLNETPLYILILKSPFCFNDRSGYFVTQRVLIKSKEYTHKNDTIDVLAFLRVILIWVDVSKEFIWTSNFTYFLSHP